MIKKMTIIVLLTLCTAILGAETRVIPMPDLMKPETLVLDKTQMYVTEGTSIYIYSLKDFKLIKKFGKKGGGPQEFMLHPQVAPLIINVSSEDIIANSLGKISWFTKDGKYKKELKLPNPLVLGIQPFGENFIGLQITQGEKMWQRLNLYDEKMNEIKNITQKEHVFQRGKGLVILEFTPFTAIYENKIFLAWENELKIKVLDAQFNELYTIKHDIEKQEITEKHKKDILHLIETDPSTKDILDFIKPIRFTSHFPAIQYLVVTGDKIYIVTYKGDDENNDQCLVMDLKGKILKQVFLPMKMSTAIQPYPYNIHEGSLYQVADNEEEEEWELHITKIN